MDENTLEEIYQEHLEEKMIDYISKKHNLDYRKAMDLYYNSNLAKKIHDGDHDIQYLDHKVLSEIMENAEKELFNRSLR